MAIVYYLLTRKEDYKDLGSHYFEQRQQEAIVRQAVRKLETLGFQVALSSLLTFYFPYDQASTVFKNHYCWA